MSELRRVLLSKRFIVVMALSLLLCCVFFAFRLADENITLSGEELTGYINGYPEFIESIGENAQNSAMLSALSENSDYIKNNAEKTVSDYSRLSGIKLSEADNTVVAAFSDNTLADASVLIMIAVALVCFSEEKAKGLSDIVRCTEKGRFALSLERSAIIAGAALLTSFLGTAFCILTGVAVRGEIDLAAPIQSVPEFRYCALPINIIQYLILNALLRALGAAAVGFIAQLFLTRLGGVPSLGIAGAFAFAEIIIYSAIDGADRMNGFKIANIIPVLHGEIFSGIITT